MNPADIGKAYDQITHLWNDENFDRRNGLEPHRHALSFITNRGNALDVGCGCTGRFIDLLQTEGFTVEGVDVSQEMIRLAKQRHPDVVFHHADICEWRPNKKYDFITAWDSIWHVPLAQQKPVLSKLVALLNKGGVLIFTFGGTEAPDEHVDDYMGPMVYYSTLGTEGFKHLLNNMGCQCCYVESDKNDGLHTYIIAKKIR